MPGLRERLGLQGWRDALSVGLPSLLLAIGAFWLAAQFVKPAPPDYLVISTGGEGGAYQSFAARYREVLSRYGVRLIEKPSAGSSENVARLRDPDFEVDVAFIQGGTVRAMEEDSLYSLGDIYYEPLWVFYREAGVRHADKLLDLKGKRIAIGSPGSGTHALALAMLAANEIDEKNTQLIAVGGMAVLEQLQKGQIDAVFAVGPTQSSLIWSLLYAPGIKLMSLKHAEAYTRRFPYLAHLVLPRGAIDLPQDTPPADTQLVSPMATLLVRDETHPALVDLLMQAVAEVHGEAGAFQRPREFPRVGHSEFPLSKEAERFYKSGKPFLQRFLPFWAATLVDRLVVMIVPLLAVLIPLAKFAPAIYAWRIRSRIFRRYGELKFLENAINENPARYSRDEWLAQLDRIEADVARVRTPLNFTDMLYTLRSHIGLVREAILRKAAT